MQAEMHRKGALRDAARCTHLRHASLFRGAKSDGSGMVGATRDMDHLLPFEIMDGGGGESRIQPADAELAVVPRSPRIHAHPILGRCEGVRLARRDRADLDALQVLDRLGRVTVLEVTMTKLTPLADAPSVQVTRLRERHRVEGAAADLLDHLAPEEADLRRHEPILIVGESELT